MFDKATGTAPRRSPKPSIFAALSTGIPTLSISVFAVFVLTPPYFRSSLERSHLEGLWDLIISRHLDTAAMHRLSLALLCAALAAGVSSLLAWRWTPLSDCDVTMPHADEPRLLQGEYARRQLLQDFKAQFGAGQDDGLWLAPDIRLPREAEAHFMLVVGDKGSGKSNILRAFASQAIARRDLVLLHCVKGDVTQSFGDDEAVLIAAHHADGWAWDAAADLNGRAAYMDLAAALIPAAGSSAFWAQAARAVFVDILQDLAEERGPAGWTFMDLTRRLLEDPAAIKAKVERLDLSASPLLEEGEDGITNTTFGVLATLWAGTLSGLRPLAIAWADTPAHRRFSVKRWLRGKGPRTVIIQTAPDYDEMSKLVASTVLGRVMVGVSDPSLPLDTQRRVTLVLDEMHAMGPIPKLELAMAVGREKGLVAIAALQSLTQLKVVYKPDRAQVIQDLFRIRIFSALAAGASADLASTLIGRRTLVWREINDNSNTKGTHCFKRGERAVVSTKSLQRDLGVKLVGSDPNNPDHKTVKAIVSGTGDVYAVDWPLTIWRKKREGFVPAAWLETHYRQPTTTSPAAAPPKPRPA